MLAGGGLRLHPDTARQIAEAQFDRNRQLRVALWLAAGAAGALSILGMILVL